MTERERVSLCSACLLWVQESKHAPLECYEIAQGNYREAKRRVEFALKRMEAAAEKVRKAAP